MFTILSMSSTLRKYVLIASALIIQWTGAALFFRAGHTKSDILFAVGISLLAIGTVWLLQMFLVPQLEPNFPWRPKRSNHVEDDKGDA